MIYCDLDDVLVDFVTAALEVHGRRDVLDAWPAGQWHIAPILGLTRAEFWGPIDAEGPGFWAGLAPLPWADELLALLESLGDVAIATAPHSHPHCYAGKFLSLTGHWRGRFADPRRHTIGGAKEGLAGPHHILIDDSAANVKAFIDAGGEAILFPQPWNYLGPLHPTRETKLAHVAAALERIAERKNWKRARR